MITKFLAYEFGGKITEVVFETETKFFLIDGSGNRTKKVTDRQVHFDTFDEAKEWKVSKARQKVGALKRQTSIANDTLNRVLAMTPEAKQCNDSK